MSKILKNLVTNGRSETNMDGKTTVFRDNKEPKPSKDGVEGKIWNDPTSNKTIWNAYEKIGKDLYRQRAEVIVFNDKGQILLSKNDKGYKIPGGSTEPNISVIETVKKESNEEAFINIKDVEYSNVRYIVEFNDYWKNKYEKLLGLEFKGFNVFVYTAKYDSEFKGKVHDHDMDKELQNAKWYDIEEVYDILREPHKKVLE